MSFHIKVLIGFVFWHVIFTAWGLIKGTLDYVEPTNDQDWVIEGIWRTGWVLMSLLLSLLTVTMAYLGRALVAVTQRRLAR